MSAGLRKEELLYLKLAVKNALITGDQARESRRLLEQLEKTGRRRKARQLLVEQGLVTPKVARDLHNLVRNYLHEKAEKAAREVELEGYEMLGKLGAGAMGVVFKARQVGVDRMVAVKLLMPDLASNDTYVERFLREARAAARLNHPNIVTCFECSKAGNVYFLSMEFVDGPNLKEVIEKEGPLDEREGLRVVAEVGEALIEASRHGIIHRDIKPANIMITTDGGRVKLTDLGLARHVEKTDCGLTQEGRAIGTPYYMSPEQATDQDKVDARSDIYGLGATFFHLVTGIPPFRATTPQGVMALHISSPIPDPRSVVPQLSKASAKLVAKMMAKNPDDRYRTPEDLVADVRAMLAGKLGSVKALGVKTPKSMPVGGGLPSGSTGTATKLAPFADYQPSDRGRRGRGRSSGTSPALMAASVAAVAALALGAVMWLGSQGSGVVPNDVGEEHVVAPPPRDERPDRPASKDDAALRELRQARQIQDVRDRIDALYSIAETFSGTPIATVAADEASEEERKLRDEERIDLDRRGLGAARQLLADGRYLEASKKLRLLAIEAEDQELREEIVDDADRADRERLKIFHQAVAKARESFLGGRPDEAERIIAGQTEVATAAEIDAARAELTSIVAGDRAGAERRHADFLLEAATDVAAVRAENALARGRALANTLATHPEVQANVRADVRSLEQVRKLEEMLVIALQEKRGREVAIQSVSGDVIQGKLMSADGRQVLIVEDGAEESRAVSLAEIADNSRLILLTGSFGAEDSAVHERFGLYLLYRGQIARGQEELLEARRLAAASGRSTDPIDDALIRSRGLESVFGRGRPRATDEPVVVVAPGSGDPTPPAGGGDRTPPSGGGDPLAGGDPLPGVGELPGATGPTNPGGTGTPDGDGERTVFINGIAVTPEEAWVFENLEKLFDGTVVGYSGTSIRLGYSFVPSNKRLGPDWRAARSTLRYDPNVFALRAEGNNEVFHEAVFGGARMLEIEFSNDVSLLDGSSLHLIIADRKGKAIIMSNFGLDLARIERGRVKARTRGADHRRRFRSGETYTIKIEVEEDAVVAYVDDEETARMEGVKLPDGTRVGFTYEKVNLQIQRIYVGGKPDVDWARKKLGAGEGKKSGSGSRGG